MESKRIVDSIFCGMKGACMDSFNFNGFPYMDIKPEYLLTVNIAQSLFLEFKGEFIIKLEENTEDFKKASVGINDLLDFQLNYLKDFEIERKGRIDIALHDPEGNSICPIEIKGMDPNKNTTLFEDIKRVIEFMRDTKINNTITNGFIAFLKTSKEWYTKSEIEDQENSYKSEYDSFMKNNFPKLSPYFTFKVYSKTVYENLGSMEELDRIQPDDMADARKEQVHYIGIIIEIIKNSPQ